MASAAACRRTVGGAPSGGAAPARLRAAAAPGAVEEPEEDENYDEPLLDLILLTGPPGTVELVHQLEESSGEGLSAPIVASALGATSTIPFWVPTSVGRTAFSRSSCGLPWGLTPCFSMPRRVRA